MRLLRHLFARSSGRLFPEDSLHRITEAIAAGERLHRGEVMFAVETNLPPSAVLAGVQLSFVVYVGAVVWAFAPVPLGRVWMGLLVPAAALAGLAALLARLEG